MFRGHKDLIYIVKWNPHDEDKLVTAGNKHIKFWSQTGLTALSNHQCYLEIFLVTTFNI